MDSIDEGEFVVEGASDSLLDMLGLPLIEASKEAISDIVAISDTDGSADKMGEVLGEPLPDSMGVALLDAISEGEE
jgi:hypothetical protein